jgi:predicted SprT family Zn-dependent metalloprotease
MATLEWAEERARVLMGQNGLFDQGWQFQFDRAVRRMGCCHHRQKLITLSPHAVELNVEQEVIDTILHEIAHALVGRGHGHDRVWKKMARRLGCTPKACAVHAKMPKGQWRAECPNCFLVFNKHRLRRCPKTGEHKIKDYWCRRCGKIKGPLEFQRVTTSSAT